MKSSLFLMEQLIAILVFAICAAVCVRLFAASYIMSEESKNMNSALIIAKNGAECYKSTFGNAEKTALILGGVCEDNAVRVYYDKDRQACKEFDGVYVLNIRRQNAGDAPPALFFGDISVEKNRGEEILTFTAAARGGTE